MSTNTSPNGTDPDDGDRSYRHCLEQDVRSDPGAVLDHVAALERRVHALNAQNDTLYALVRVQRDEIERLRPIVNAAAIAAALNTPAGER